MNPQIPHAPPRWRWPDRPPRRPAPRWRKPALQTVVMGLVGLLLYAGLGHHTAGFVIWGLALVLLVLNLASPAASARIEAWGTSFGRFVGAVLSWLLLVPTFVLVFVPAGVVMRLRGRDPMRRKPRESGLSYWVPRRLPFVPEHYARQFLVEDREARTLARPVGTAPEPRSDS
jgi:hypothetical protein